MKEGEFDFNTYSKTGFTDEEQEVILKEISDFIDTCREAKRKQFYELPNDESKLLWLRKAVVNCEALNELLEEFIPQLKVIDEINEQTGKTRAQLDKLLFDARHMTSYVMSIHMTSLWLMIRFISKTKIEKEEIEKLKEMMK